MSRAHYLAKLELVRRMLVEIVETTLVMLSGVFRIRTQSVR